MNLAEKNFKVWSKEPFDKKTTDEVYRLKEKLGQSEFNDIFHKDLEFGTGGMRGIMGIGPNRINKYSLGKTTQGICNFINDLKIKDPKEFLNKLIFFKNNNIYYEECLNPVSYTHLTLPTKRIV